LVIKWLLKQQVSFSQISWLRAGYNATCLNFIGDSAGRSNKCCSIKFHWVTVECNKCL
jgi:hypothetical protein